MVLMAGILAPGLKDLLLKWGQIGLCSERAKMLKAVLFSEVPVVFSGTSLQSFHGFSSLHGIPYTHSPTIGQGCSFTDPSKLFLVTIGNGSHGIVDSFFNSDVWIIFVIWLQDEDQFRNQLNNRFQGVYLLQHS